MTSSIKPWRTLSSALLIQDRWLSVRADSCETADGVSVSPYYVLECGDWVSSVAVTKQSEIVLVRQYRHAAGRITLELPAGEMDEGEGIIQAARREVVEESGFGGGEAKLIFTSSPNPARYANRIHAVLIEGVAEVEGRANTAAENTETVLWPLRDAAQLFVFPEFCDCTSAATLASVLAGSQGMRV